MQSSTVHKHSHSKDKGNKRKATRVQRACLNCRKRKQGCEEERPCRRCVEKGIECVEVEPKRKRGRAKTYSQRSKERAGSRSEETPEYELDEDDAEDSCESEEEITSEEDQSSTVSPRGSASNIPSCSANVIQTHTFSLSGSNTSSSSNIHMMSSSHSRAHSPARSLSSSNSQTPSTSSPVPVTPTSRRQREVRDSMRDSNGSLPVKNFQPIRTQATPLCTLGTSPPDSPNPGDDNDEIDVADSSNQVEEMEAEDTSYMEDYCYQIAPKGGLNLALLLPFIGNLGGTIEEQFSDPMFVEEPFAYLLESELFNLSHFFNSTNTHSSNQQMNYSRESAGQLGIFKNGTHYASNPFDFDDFHSRIWRKNDFSFYHSRRSKDRLLIEEGDSKSQIYIKQCWAEFQSKCESKLYSDALDMDLQRVSDAWKEIMKNLRNVEHQKAQALMEELGKLPMNSSNYFGKGIQPSMIFWTSGGRFQYANESFCKLTGYNIDDLQDAKNSMIGAYTIFHPEEVMRILKRQLEAIHQPDKSSYQMNTKLIGKYSKEISVSCSVVNVRDTLNGLPMVTMAVFI